MPDDGPPATSGPGRKVCWAFAAAIPLLTLFAELLPVAFGTGYNAVWDWSFLYVTIRFVALPIGGTLAALLACFVGVMTGPRTWTRLRPAIILLGLAVTYDLALLLPLSSWSR